MCYQVVRLACICQHVVCLGGWAGEGGVGAVVQEMVVVVCGYPHVWCLRRLSV